MKTFFAVLAALTLWTTNALAADPPSAGNEALFDRLDADHNGSIAVAEISSDNRTLFDRLLRRSDADHNNVLSRDEFLAGLVPTRPEKSLEAKQPAIAPEANAIRYLLLAMDTDRNARIEKKEVPARLLGAFEMMAERMDRNNNDSLERQELSRGGPALSAAAGRFVQRSRIDVNVELAKLEKAQGDDVNRFEQQPMPLSEMRDGKQARKIFAQIDENGDGKIDSKEVPEPLRQPIERLTRIADRDNDGKLSEQEFATGAERMSRFMKGRPDDRKPFRDMRENRRLKSGDSDSAKSKDS